MNQNHHPPLLGTAGSFLSSLGMVDAVREHVHTLGGIVGDLGGIAITILTLCYWVTLWRKKMRGR